jgi:hypothetical protein
MTDRLTRIREAIDTFDIELARELLREELKSYPSAEAYYLAAQVALNDNQKKSFLEKAIELDPFHAAAHQAQSTGTKENTKEEPIPSSAAKANTGAAGYREAIPVTGKNPGEMFIRALITSHTNLLIVPHEKSTVRLQLAQLTEVIVLARDSSGSWCNVVFKDPVDSTNAIGWVQSVYLRNFNVTGRPINMQDLPISNYEYNTRKEVKKLARLVSNEVNSSGTYQAGCAVLGLGILFSLFIYLYLDRIIGAVLFLVTLIVAGVLTSIAGGPVTERSKSLWAIAKRLGDDQEQARSIKALNANEVLARAILTGRY